MIEEVRFNLDGLVPVIAQDAHDGTILMLAWANKEALEETLRTGFGTYFSRSRQKLWRNGDSVIYKVEQKGNIACHTGHRSCFYRSWDGKDWKENAPVLKSPEEMYGKGHH